MQIQGKEYLIEKVFSNDFEFKIPAFQRAYAWQAEHANDLYDDLFEAANAYPDRAAESAPLYFLGSVVTIKADNSPVAEVVDGQQRLTTLSLLISLLRYAIKDQRKSEYLSDFLSAKGDPFLGTDGRPRLAVRDDDQQYYADIFVSANGVRRLVDEAVNDPRTISAKNMIENAKSLLRRIGDASQHQLERLATFLLKRCVLVVVSSPDLDSAFRIFSVLNDRGLNLSAADILKAEVLQHLPEDARSTPARRWESLEDDLGSDAFEDLISQIRMIYKRQIVSNIAAEYRKDILPEFKGTQFIDDVLEPYGRHMETVRSCSHEGHRVSDSINTVFRFLNMIDNSDWVAPALVVMKTSSSQPERVLEQLQHLERLAAFMLVSRMSRVPRIKRYGEMLGQLLADPAALPSAADLSSEEKARFRNQLSGDLYLLNNVPKYILLRLESCLNDSDALWNHRVISIEHVLPQNPSADSEWCGKFSDTQREILTHKIGNLVILSRKKNSSAKAYDFAKKKQSYFGRAGGTSFAWTNGVVSQEDWTPELIEQRTVDAVSHLADFWNLGE
ncbi:MAG: DUF262 domain-containing protein [Phycisphaerales bacterium]|nr:DUF262 domain-containing protein [Phycisphaerales bacterium]